MAAVLGKDPDAMSAADRRAAIIRLSDALRYLSRKDVDTDAVDLPSYFAGMKGITAPG